MTGRIGKRRRKEIKVDARVTALRWKWTTDTEKWNYRNATVRGGGGTR